MNTVKWVILGCCVAIGLLLPIDAPRASDPVCANPMTVSEDAICEDRYLLGMDIEINLLLGRLTEGPEETLPEWLQMDYGHHLIGREDCEGGFRCLESVLSDYIDFLTSEYLTSSGTGLADYQHVSFVVHQSQDSPGNDLLPWDHPDNFGWTERLCQLRCAAAADCAASAFDPLQQVGGVPGYCTMKSVVNFPLGAWTDVGVFMVKQ
ncbi:MAG: hypothetical protein AAFX39_09935 [Pseudomonadota bacterium]